MLEAATAHTTSLLGSVVEMSMSEELSHYVTNTTELG